MKPEIQQLIDQHPLKSTLATVVLQAWDIILDSKIGDFRIGKDIFPEPQIMGFFLHDVIALLLAKQFPDEYCLGNPKTQKDIHNLLNDTLSIEIKTSSSSDRIFANRSYAQPQKGDEKKNKDGYFLVINFEKFTCPDVKPRITLIRMAYLSHADWIAQKASTSQQAHLSAETYRNNFETLYALNPE